MHGVAKFVRYAIHVDLVTLDARYPQISGQGRRVLSAADPQRHRHRRLCAAVRTAARVLRRRVDAVLMASADFARLPKNLLRAFGAVVIWLRPGAGRESKGYPVFNFSSAYSDSSIIRSSSCSGEIPEKFFSTSSLT